MNTSTITIEGITYQPSKKSTNKTELKPLDILLQPGEIHTILGEKESGKSLISNILKGNLKATSGIISIGNKVYKNLSIKESRRNGIEVVTDKLFLLEHTNVGEQFFIYHHTKKQRKLYNAGVFNKEVNTFLENYETDFTAETNIDSLSASDKIFLEILISIFCEPKFLVLDEVLSRLTTNDWNKTIRIIKQFSESGGIVLLLINHIDYIPVITSRLSVLRNGEIVLTDLYGNLDKYNLIKILYSHVLNNNYSIASNKDFYNMIKYNQAILVDLPVVLIALDKNYNIKFLNLHAEKYFQTKTTKMLNHPLRALLTIPEQAITQIKDESKSPLSIKSQIFFNGIRRIANITSFAIQEAGKSIGRILILTDITEEETLREHIVQNEKLASVGMLAAGVAHEINHPLGIIKNIIEIMKYSYKENSLTEDVETIEDEIKIISQIISNLMGFSGEENASLEVFDIADLIQRVVRLLNFYAKKNSVSINFINKDWIYEIYANKTEIRQVFLNLIRNAIEAMPNGGELTILINYKDNEKVEIIFQDTGTGINAEKIEDIFLPFYSSKKNQSSSMGMGLFISYNTITKFKGEITAENIPEGGTKFTIFFPLMK